MKIPTTCLRTSNRHSGRKPAVFRSFSAFYFEIPAFLLTFAVTNKKNMTVMEETNKTPSACKTLYADMRHTILAVLLLLCTASGSAQRKTIDLSGRWQSSLGSCTLPGTTDENRLGSGKHPTDVTTQLTRLFPYSGIVSYERDFDLTKDMEQMALTLEIERTKPSTLWIDGDSIGSIRQLYAPHVYVLPASLKAGTHHVRIDIDNRNEAVPSGVHGSHAWTDATQTNWNGMLGRMEIVAKPRTFIQSMRLYPDVEKKAVTVRMQIHAEKAGKYYVALTCSAVGHQGTIPDARKEKMVLQEGMNEVERTLWMGDDVRLWSEFHPNLYTMTATVSSKRTSDQLAKTFGMRNFTTEGTQFVINGHKTFLRGTHDACVFPLTAYCPTDVKAWRRLFAIAKQYGINHYRFHSYTPTEAAFTAADEEGIYLHTELPMWGTINANTVELNDFLRNEAFSLLDFLGDHPSFVSLGLGNELWVDPEMATGWLEEFRQSDSRHLYSQGSNNDLGWKGPKEGGEDFYITCRVGTGDGFSTHVRTSFSFADADHGGILNWNRPGTTGDFSHAVSLCKTPIVSHESCQFQIYPDYKELPKYTGVLYPYNLEIFRDRLKENGLESQIDAFHEATGKWAVDCYKADMEYCLRTPGFGGFQLLDIKDYPGQGSALCGILDAFMDSKGLVRPADFRGWNAPVVPMAVMASHCWSNTDTLRVAVRLCNYTEDVYRTPVEWQLKDDEGLLSRSGQVTYDGLQEGEVAQVGNIIVPLADVERPARLRLTLKTGDYHNYYHLWVYPQQTADRTAGLDFLASDTLDEHTMTALRQGKRVLLTPRHGSIEKQSVGGLFTPDYWNYAMFKTISEQNHKPVSPGTLGMLMNPKHPVFAAFPTEGRTDWQWWSIALHSRPLILNSLPKDYRPVIQTVDNVERNHKLGILMEFRMGEGRLLVCTTDLAAISEYVEGRAYANALKMYVAAKTFNPSQPITEEELRALLYSETKTRNIQGVKNITDYTQHP